MVPTELPRGVGRGRRRARLRASGALAAVAATALVLAGCGGGGGGQASGGSTQVKGTTITVALAADPPPQALMNQFTQQSGVTVKWVNVDWDSLQTKISAAATAKTYFADATDVDWSRVGQLGRLGWFYDMNDYVKTGAMKADVPQLASFTTGGHVVGIPYDASFMVTTVNADMFKQAGITSMPTTMQQYTADLQQVKAKGVTQTPLNIPFAAAEGLSTYWYEATHAFGGTILDAKGKPQFSTPDSAGYKAAQWMVDAYKQGLVPQGNINVADSQGQQTLMAQGVVASTFSDYSGTIGGLYEDTSQSKVAGKVQYLPTPGTSGPVENLSNPDGIGIPKQAKHPQAAAAFIDWFTSADTQAQLLGLKGAATKWTAYTLPSHLVTVKQLAASGLVGGQLLQQMLSTSKPVFDGGAPTAYPRFSNAVYTHLHAAAAGSETVAQAMAAITDAANQLANG